MQFSFIYPRWKLLLRIALTLSGLLTVFSQVEGQVVHDDTVEIERKSRTFLMQDTLSSQLKHTISKASQLLETSPQEAYLLAIKAQELAEALKANEYLYKAYETQYLAAKNMGNDSLAYANLAASIAVKTEDLENTKLKLEKDLNDKYSIRQKENEIALLKHEKKLHQLKLANNKRLFNIALPSFLLLLVLSFILWRQYKRKKTLQLMLKENHTKTILLNTELTNINKELIESEHQLKQLNEVKNNFFSVVSQDLKSPLSSLSLYLNNFIESGSKDNNAHTFIQRINTSVTSLSSLINNLLEWSRLQMGSMQYHAEVLDIKVLLEKNIALIQPQTAHKRIILEQKLQPGLKALVDKQMLGFVFRKMLSLFIEAVEEEATIIVSSKKLIKEQHLLRIKIKSQQLIDTENDLLNSWEFNSQYMKGSEKSRNNILGLMLCKEFIEKQGGTLHVSNSKKSIRFTFPLA